jgi:predicted DsbA family dithiol-disulfide isomerase
MTEASPRPQAAFAIDVVSDVVCPWCYIGKRQLDEALARWAERHPGAPPPPVAWHPFQLNPGMPSEGMPRRDYLLTKFGSPDGGPGYGRVVAAAQAAGLRFHPERIVRQPNTLRAHSLIAHAGERQHAIAAALFEAYFVEGADIGDQATLRAIGHAHGMEDAQLDSALADPALAATAGADEQIRDQGVSGVPLFVVGRRVAVSGAQGVDALLQAFERAAGVGAGLHADG